MSEERDQASPQKVRLVIEQDLETGHTGVGGTDDLLNNDLLCHGMLRRAARVIDRMANARDAKKKNRIVGPDDLFPGGLNRLRR